MKLTKPTASFSLMVLLSALYCAPAFAGATNSGDNTSATPGENSSTTTTPTDPASTTLPADPSVTPDTPAVKAKGTGGATDNTRSDTSKAGEMKSKSMKNCDVNVDRNCDKTRAR